MRSLLVVLVLAACGSKPAPVEPPAPPVFVDERPVTSESLAAYFRDAFPDAVAAGVITLDYGSNGVDAEVVEELRVLGITTMGAFEAIVPADFATRGVGALQQANQTANVAGTARSLLIVHDTRGYFDKAWGQKWFATGPSDFPIELAYGVDLGLLTQLGVFGDDDGGYGGEGYGGVGYGDL